MTERRRRASAGYTYDACPGCHQLPERGQRKKDEVCDSCKTKLAEADMHRARIRDIGRVAYGFDWNDYGFYEGIYEHEHSGNNTGYVLAAALREAIEVTHELIGGREFDDAAQAHGLRFPREAARAAFEKTGGRIGGMIFTSLRDNTSGTRGYAIMSPTQRAKWDAIDRAIRQALVETRENARAQGASLLMQLHNGGITLDEFNEETRKKVREYRERVAAVDKRQGARR
jgi:hypothetical protein